MAAGLVQPSSPGDFTIDWRTVRVLGLAVLIGAVSAVVAWGLLDLIGLFTHLFYYGTVGVGLVQPSESRLGAFSVLIPIAPLA